MLRCARRIIPALLPFAMVTNAALLHAQELPDSGAGSTSLGERSAPPDSSAVLREARNAQATFERARRQSFPRKIGSSPPKCDEIIGRFCHWEDDETDDVLVREPVPPEPVRTLEARARLLTHLDRASQLLPGDEWIAGMHVHYLLEAGQLERALERAEQCGAQSWWCDALAGTVHHAAWRHTAADSAFDRALAAMPESDRCAWTDLEDLVGERMRSTYRRASCAERAALDDWIWWLADPLYMRPGNDRRAEHFTRIVRSRLHARAASGYGMRWGDDLDEIARRYGWPSHYAQEIPQMGRMEPPRVSSYHESPTYHFLADAGVIDDLRDIPDSAWTLRPATARERYAPPYATFAHLTHLGSLFRRGDSVLLVVSYDASDDSLLMSQPITAALVASIGPRALHDRRVMHHGAAGRGTLLLPAPDTPLLASAELMAGARVRRARFGVGFRDSTARALQISDLALFEPTDSLPEDLTAFLPLARATDRVTEGARLGLFWEVYGAPASADELTLNVEIIREGGGWLRRAGERVGLVGPPARVRFGWRDVSPGVAVAARSLVIDLAGLDRGRYLVEVSLTPDGTLPVVARRTIEIIR